MCVRGSAPVVTENAPLPSGLSPVKGKPVRVTLDGGRPTLDAGLPVLAEIERRQVRRHRDAG
jgi:hypothetical protein